MLDYVAHKQSQGNGAQERDVHASRKRQNWAAIKVPAYWAYRRANVARRGRVVGGGRGGGMTRMFRALGSHCVLSWCVSYSHVVCDALCDV